LFDIKYYEINYNCLHFILEYQKKNHENKTFIKKTLMRSS